MKQRPKPISDLAELLEEANVHRAEGRHDQAMPIYRRLELSHPHENDPPYFIALIEMIQGRPAQALPRLKRLTERLPNTAPVWLAYAQALRESGQWFQSIQPSRRALTLSPTDTVEAFALASALELIGKLDDALDLLQSLAQDSHTRLRALVQIARISPASIGPAEQEALSVGARAAENSASFRCVLNYALAPLLETQGLYDEAFEAFADGARLKRAVLTGQIAADPDHATGAQSRAVHPDECERIGLEETRYMKSLCTPQFLADEQGRGSDVTAPIFIIGMPRSGSTLIAQILSSHSQVKGLGETVALVETLLGKYPFDLQQTHGPNHFRRLSGAYLAAMRERGWRDTPRFIDKMLNNFVYVGIIHLMFPKAAILHAVRDPVDTCLSNFRTLFGDGQEESYDLAEIGRAYVRYRKMDGPMCAIER